MSDINKFTSKEVLNKVLLDSSGNAVNAFSHTTQEALNAALDATNNRLNVSLAGGTISGDVTISGDLTVTGGGGFAYTEVISASDSGSSYTQYTNSTTGSGATDGTVFGIGGGEQALIWNYESTSILFGTADTTALTIDSSQNATFANNVGIGASPSDTLHLSASVPIIRLTDTDTNDYHRIYGSNGGLYFDADKGNSVGSSVMGFGIDDVRVLTLNSGGNATFAGDVKVTDNLIIDSTAGNPANQKIQFHDDNVGLQRASGSDRTANGNSLYVSAFEDIVFSASGAVMASQAERMRIADDGKVTIADTAEDVISLEVGGAVESSAGLSTYGAAATIINKRNSADQHGLIVASKNADSFPLKVGRHDSALTDLVVDGAGNVGINTDDPTFFFTAIGDATGDQATINQTHASYAGSALKIGAVRAANSAYNLLYCATGTSAAGTSGTAQFVVSGDGTVGIGTSSPSDYNALANNLVVYENGSGGITIASSTSGTGSLYFADDTSGDNAYKGSIEYVHGSTNELRFRANSVIKLVLDPDSRISLSNNDSGTGNTIFGKSTATSLDAGSNYNVLVGASIATGSMNDATHNVAVGSDALQDITTGDDNIAIGSSALLNITTGSSNVVIGRQSGDAVTSQSNLVLVGKSAGGAISSDNANGTIAIGFESLTALTDGASNTAVGYKALNDATTEIGNVSIGYKSGEFIRNDASDYNVLIGTESGVGGTGARNHNIAMGYRAMGSAGSQNNIGGNENIFIGSYSGNGTWVTAGCDGNTAVGYDSLSGALNGALQNTAVGKEAMKGNTTGDYNVALGNEALKANEGGQYNIAIGHQSMLVHTGGLRNVAIGAFAMKDTDSGSPPKASDDCVLIGYSAGGGTWANQDCSNLIGIGTSALAGALAGDTADGAVAIGRDSLTAMTTGAGNTAVGYKSGASLVDGNNNSILGFNAGYSLTEGLDNVVVGYGALYAENDGDYCVAVGSLALNSQTGVSGGVRNTAIGYKAGYAVTTGVRNVIIGTDAAVGMQNADECVVIGNYAMAANATQDGTVAIGRSALAALTSGVGATVVGYQAGDAITGGDYNTAIGYQALSTEDTGDRNTAVGYGSLLNVNGANDNANTALGYLSGTNISTGTKNVAIGADSGGVLASGNYNTLIGHTTAPDASDGENQIVIGYHASGQGDNTVTLGNGDITDVYMAEDSGAAVRCGKILNSNTTINTAVSYTGLSNVHTKTAGATNASDDFYGEDTSITFNDGDAFYYSLIGGHFLAYSQASAGESNNIRGVTSVAKMAGSTDINDIYGLHTTTDVDAGTVDGNVFGSYVNVDVDGGAIGAYIYGQKIDIDTTVNPTGNVFGMEIQMGGSGADATGDYFFRCHDLQNGDTVAQITALAGVATFDSGDFSGAPDYAEYFESKDGKAIAIGSTVKLDGDKIVACSDGDTPMGVIRPKASSAVVANCATTRYQGKYLKTDYDEIILEDYKIKEWTEEITFEEYTKRGKDETGGVLGGAVKDSKVEDKYYRKHSYHSDRLPSDVTPPSDAVELTPSHQRKKLNPDYDPSKVYKNRKERDEWCLVGLLGQIPITKGQPVASNWIKMNDVSDTVEMYFVK